MSEPEPFFSIITPVYNGAAFLPDLIASVQAQTFSDYEHIIIDDGSTDDGATIGVLEAVDDSRIHWWTRANRGQYATQNEGIQAARGRWIVVIAADDILAAPDVLQTVADYIQTHPVCDVVYGKTARMDADGNPLPDLELFWRPSRWLMRHYCYVAHCSLYISRDYVFANDLLFDAALRYAGDWDWQIRIFDDIKRVRHIAHPLAVLRLHPNQTSRITTRTIPHDEYARVRERYSINGILFSLVRRFAMLRGMALMALYRIRREGPIAAIRRWLRSKRPPR
jgi:glycosyltransferase involved in cell wall biosynthesis